MNEEYIIINKSTIMQRINELENKQGDKEFTDPKDYSYLIGKIHQLEQVLLFSTPLTPELEKIWNAARETVIVGTPPFEAIAHKYKTIEDYISKKK